MGPTQDYMPRDLEAWLKDPARKVRNLDLQLQTDEDEIEGLRGQIDNLNSELDQQTGELENQISRLKIE